MIYIYSGHVPELDDHLSAMLGSTGLITVIPPTPNDHATAVDIASYFGAIDINAQTLTKRAYANKIALKNQIFSSSAVYLCGGNTYEFLQFAKIMDLFTILGDFEENSGIIASESAGSIILSRDISTAAIPSSCPDENTINLRDFTAMNRIPFHISPHFSPNDEDSKADIEELQTLANQSNRQVLLLEDGEGFVMQENEIIFFQGNNKKDKKMLEPVSASENTPTVETSAV